MNTIDKEQAGQAEEKNTTDYDSAWKDVIEELFEPFMEFFFPEAHRDIDFSKGFDSKDH